MPEEKRKRGRPRLSEEEKERRKLERMGLLPVTNPPPPPMGDAPKNGGKGVDKEEQTREIIRNVREGLKANKVDTRSADDIRNRFDEYLENCENRGIVPSKEGVMLWFGINKSTWSRIINRVPGYERSDDVVEALETINSALGAITSSAADAGKISPAIAVLKLTNSYGYRDVKQVEHTNDINVQIGTSDLKGLLDKYGKDQYFIDTDFKEVTRPGENDNAENAEQEAAESIFPD